MHYNPTEPNHLAANLDRLPDGPYRVEGEVTILDRDGRPTPSPGSPVHLCRCGRSASKPFCDGSHARTGWSEDA